MEVGGHRRRYETRSRALSVETREVSSGGRRPGLILETSSSGAGFGDSNLRRSLPRR